MGAGPGPARFGERPCRQFLGRLWGGPGAKASHPGNRANEKRAGRRGRRASQKGLSFRLERQGDGDAAHVAVGMIAEATAIADLDLERTQFAAQPGGGQERAAERIVDAT